LASLLASLVGDGESHALLALILLTDARRATRVDENGVPVLLEVQDRAQWDRSKISEGLRQLELAAGQGLGPYGLQATVASFHAVSPSFADTEWMRIVALYDRMLEQGGGAVVALNRAAALSYVDGPAAGLAAMKDLAEELDGYLYFHSARAELLRRLELVAEAKAAYERALECHPAEAEAAFIHRQLDTLPEFRR
jgi:RNA polymerase sigma-70 factor (ECF subfamily)